eukprot:TRINITY_DN8495_c0_g1_i1.p1 TRINITY_DN8495_c0_g1~~TRINITY_DN8495_c0_g1_i1.p1  ORF type:complete len:188 (+),score=37.87 TRINITY_DN8495_c0_g1_i1:26-589(+)
MYSPEKVTGLRELFNAVTENNEGVEIYGLRGSVDNQIYVRIRGQSDTGRLLWGAGPKKLLNFGGKAKNGEMSKTFKAIYDLVKENDTSVKLEEFHKKLSLHHIAYNAKFVDMDDYQIIVEAFDPVFVQYKGGRKQIKNAGGDSGSKRENIVVDIQLDKKIKQEAAPANNGPKRGINRTEQTSETKRW